MSADTLETDAILATVRRARVRPGRSHPETNLHGIKNMFLLLS